MRWLSAASALLGGSLTAPGAPGRPDRGTTGCPGRYWDGYYSDVSEVVELYNAGEHKDVLQRAAELLRPLAQNPQKVLDCATAVAATLHLLGLSAELLGEDETARFARQGALVFASGDAHRHGVAYIDESPWPLTWSEAYDGVAKGAAAPAPAEPAAAAETAEASLWDLADAPALKVAVVTVCAGKSALIDAAIRNKEAYAAQHGYHLEVFSELPWLQDGVVVTPPPPAWAKFDAILTVVGRGEFDAVLWVECDALLPTAESVGNLTSFTAVPAAEKQAVKAMAAWRRPAGARASLRDEVARLDKALRDLLPGGKKRPLAPRQQGLKHNRLGWTRRLLTEPSAEVLLSEDGTFLQTSVLCVRASPFAFWSLQKARALGVEHLGIAQHPFAERAALWWLLALPALLERAAGGARSWVPSVRVAPRLVGWPPLLASGTTPQYQGEFAVVAGGCTAAASEEVCRSIYSSYGAF